MRGKAVIVIIAVLAIASFFGAAAFAADNVIKIGAILAVTGPAAYLGGPEARTLEMLVADVNKAGGILGRQVQLIVKDSQGSAEKAVSFAKQLVEEDEVLAIIGPSTSGESMSLKGYCDQNETILISCAAAETIVNPVAKWVFKTPQNDAFAAIKIYQTMKTLGITKIGVVVSNSGFGQGGKAQLVKYAPEYGITIAHQRDLRRDEHRPHGRAVQGEGGGRPGRGELVRRARPVPRGQEHAPGRHGRSPCSRATGSATSATCRPRARRPRASSSPAAGSFYADLLPASHPQKQVLVGYKRAYEAKYKEDASTFGGHAYDAFLVVAEAREEGRNDRQVQGP